MSQTVPPAVHVDGVSRTSHIPNDEHGFTVVVSVLKRHGERKRDSDLAFLEARVAELEGAAG
jgi:hypothetical protein